MNSLDNNSKKIALLLLALAFLLLYFPNLLLYRPSNSPAQQLLFFETLIFGLFFWLFWFSIFRNVSVALYLSIVPSLWWSATVYLRLTYSIPINHIFVSIAIEADWREIKEFAFTFGFGLPAIAIFVVAFLSLAAYVAQTSKLEWKHKSRLWILLGLPLVFAAMFYQFNYVADDTIKNDGSELQVLRTKWHWLDKWTNVYPFDLVVALVDSRKETAGFSAALSNLEKYPPPTVRQEKSRGIEKIVLIIGESANAERWQLYGSARKTTPYLSSKNDLLVFSDMVTPSIATRNSVPLLLSRTPLIKSSLHGENIANEKSSPSLLRLFSAAGYETNWYSNQSSDDKFDSPIKLYANQAFRHKFLNLVNYHQQGSFDEILLNPLKLSLQPHTPQLFVLHTLGSHFHYAQRYPAHYEFFQPSLKSEQSINMFTRNAQDIASVKNAYDNSVRYTDDFLRQTIEELNNQQTSTIVLYVADHGEDIFEENCKHRLQQRTSKASYRVPAFVWANKHAITTNPQAIDRIRSRLNQPLMTTDVLSILLDFAAISPELTDSQLEHWLSPNWRSGKRIVGQDYGFQIDYDRAVKLNPCEIIQSR